jgi:hypothetical protein
LAPEEAALADKLAEELADGSFSQLSQLLLNTIGRVLLRQIEELRAAGLEPGAHLFIAHTAPADTDDQIRRFYSESTWPEHGRHAP